MRCCSFWLLLYEGSRVSEGQLVNKRSARVGRPVRKLYTRCITCHCWNLRWNNTQKWSSRDATTKPHQPFSLKLVTLAAYMHMRSNNQPWINKQMDGVWRDSFRAWLHRDPNNNRRVKEHHLTVRDKARQTNVNFLMCDLVTGLPAFILLLGLFCWGKKN